MSNIVIIGTGQIGTSIALRLRSNAQTAGVGIVGVESYRDHALEARRLNAFDEVTPNASKALRDAGLVVLCTPVMTIAGLLREHADEFPPGSVITDTGSAKAHVQRTAREVLPQTVTFIGGHPMAGTTGRGPKAGNAALFEGARWVITPDRRAPEPAIDLVLGLVAQLGAKPMLMDAEEHDAYVAAISHLPLLSSTALFQLARRSQAWPELSMLAAGGFRSTARLAGTDERMAHDIARANRAQLVHWLDRYVSELNEVRQLLNDPERDEELFRYFAEANINHTAFEAGAVGRREVDEVEMPDLSMFDLLMGGALAQRARELAQEPAADERERRERRGERR